MKSEKTLLEKIASIQDKIGPMVKDSKAHNYKYADLNQILEKLQPLLREEGLVITQPIQNGCVKTRIADQIEHSNHVSSEIPLPEGVKPQDMGSAITYYRRYTLMSLLALQAEDDDGKAAHESTSKATGLSEVVFGKLRNAYLEKGTMTPDMQEYFEKCSPEQQKRIADITKQLRKKTDAKV